MPEINYALESGLLAGALRSLAYKLAKDGLLKDSGNGEAYDQVRDICDEIIKDARAKSKQ